MMVWLSFQYEQIPETSKAQTRDMQKHENTFWPNDVVVPNLRAPDARPVYAIFADQAGDNVHLPMDCLRRHHKNVN